MPFAPGSAVVVYEVVSVTQSQFRSRRPAVHPSPGRRPNKIDADEALRIGLIDRLVPAGTVVNATSELARSIAGTTTASALVNKEMALRSPAMDPISALAYETLAYREVIWRPEVNERVQEAFAAIRARRGDAT